MAKSTLKTNILYTGDSAKLLGDKNKFPDRSINLIITSPPYADKRKSTYGGIHPDNYVEWFKPISQELHRILKDNGSFILNIKEHPKNGERGTYVLELILEMKKQGWLWIEEYCWYKKKFFPRKVAQSFSGFMGKMLTLYKEERFQNVSRCCKSPNW